MPSQGGEGDLSDPSRPSALLPWGTQSCISIANEKARLSTSNHTPHTHSQGKKLETQVSLELPTDRMEDPQAVPERAGNLFGC